jgi:hypothetical protein
MRTRAGRAEALLAALLAAYSPVAGAADLGTLFHTPEERERLDRLRRGDAVSAQVPLAPGQRAITGYVKRSDGRSTVWIDGVPVEVPTSRSAPLLEPGVVRGYADRGDEDLRIERKPRR